MPVEHLLSVSCQALKLCHAESVANTLQLFLKICMAWILSSVFLSLSLPSSIHSVCVCVLCQFHYFVTQSHVVSWNKTPRPCCHLLFVCPFHARRCNFVSFFLCVFIPVKLQNVIVPWHTMWLMFPSVCFCSLWSFTEYVMWHHTRLQNNVTSWHVMSQITLWYIMRYRW